MAARKLKPETESPSNLQNNRPGGNTAWKNGVPASGWYRMPDAWWRHLPRLQRGLYQRMLIEFVWASMVPRETAGTMPEWSPWLSYVEMAKQFRCTPDQLRDDADNANERGLIERQGSRGKVRFRVLWERWGNLKDYQAPAPRLLKKERAQPLSRWLAGVSVKPGGSYDFTVPDLPADFRLQKISLRNTGESGEVVFAGGGPAEGGVLVLEASSGAEIESMKSTSSAIEQESTPATAGGRRVVSDDGGGVGARNSRAGGAVSGKSSREDAPGRIGSTDQSPQTDTLRECIRVLSAHGTVSESAFLAWFRKQSLGSDVVLEALRNIEPSRNASDPVAWILSIVPRYVSGTYKPARSSEKQKKQAEREKLSDDIWFGGKKSA